jgi:hypothetical protein
VDDRVAAEAVVAAGTGTGIAGDTKVCQDRNYPTQAKELACMGHLQICCSKGVEVAN